MLSKYFNIINIAQNGSITGPNSSSKYKVT